jgi:hypothetical protein
VFWKPAWEPWRQFMQQAVAETSKRTTGNIAAIRKLAEHTTEYVRERLPKIYTRELGDVFFEQPYCRIGNLVDKGSPSAKPRHATCMIWLTWACCVKCRSARRSSSFIPS